MKHSAENDDILVKLCELLGLDPSPVGNINIRPTANRREYLVTVELLVDRSVFDGVPEVEQTIEH
jgi:hypothetical protein